MPRGVSPAEAKNIGYATVTARKKKGSR